MVDLPDHSDALTVSLVSTVRNEEESIDDLLRSIASQTRLPDELIIADGGSTDRTVAQMRAWSCRLPITVIELADANISQGRNAAIARAAGELIAVVDAGVRLDPQWLERIVTPFAEEGSVVDAVGGFFLPRVENEFERALAAATLPDAVEILPDSFLPSSRSFAFRRRWFEAGVRYPEWLDYCEDLIFDLRLKRAGANVVFCPGAIVWFRPRTSSAAFMRQYFRYARGDGKSGLFLKRHLIRYATYVALLPSVFLVRSWWWRAAAGLGALLYMRALVQRITRRYPGVTRAQKIRLAAVSAGLRLLGDLAKMAGYPVGLAWRARRYGLKNDWRTIPERKGGQIASDT
jgi:glycosyltransferase involved in cell wall biosynthesis